MKSSDDNGSFIMMNITLFNFGFTITFSKYDKVKVYTTYAES